VGPLRQNGQYDCRQHGDQKICTSFIVKEISGSVTRDHAFDAMFKRAAFDGADIPVSLSYIYWE
jgi:hypothetical protein